jgi:uncharacterized membrane protein YhhN
VPPARPGRIWLVAYLVVAAANLVAVLTGARLLGFVTLAAAVPLLVGWYLARRPVRDRELGWILLALGFCWLGDWLGDELLSSGIALKLVLFLIGHCCYVAAFWPYRRAGVLRRPVALLPYVLVIGTALVVIVPRAGVLGAAVVAYGLLLGLMAVLATGVDRLAAVGGALFAVSDLTIAVSVWVVRVPTVGAGLVIMGCYLAAQLLLVAGVLRRAGSPAGVPAATG